MKYFASLFCCLIISYGFSESIQNIKYHLPEAAKTWQIGHKKQNERGTTLIYIPKKQENLQVIKEFFGVNANDLPVNLSDLSIIETSLSQIYRHLQINVEVLEKIENGIIYEWSAHEDGWEIIHGWGRIFANKRGTVILTYQTEKVSDIARTRSIWLPVLQEAHSG